MRRNKEEGEEEKVTIDWGPVVGDKKKFDVGLAILKQGLIAHANLDLLLSIFEDYHLTSTNSNQDDQNREKEFQEGFDKLQVDALIHHKPSALWAMGRIYSKGLGIDSDESKAFKCYWVAGQLGYPQAQSSLGFAYANGKSGLPVNLGKVKTFYELAAQQGETAALVHLGTWYHEGVEGLVARDSMKAAQMYQLAAQQGCTTAQFNLGILYGDKDTPVHLRNEEKAFDWFLTSAKGKNLSGIVAVGYCYLNGVGVAVDKRKGLEYYSIASIWGKSKASHVLSTMYMTGEVVAWDSAKARQYLNK